MDRQRELADELARFALFSDLKDPELLAAVEIFDEASFQEGDRVLRQGLSGSGFYIIIRGEASIRLDGIDRTTLGKGDFFGEISILLGEKPVADVVALSALHCLVLPGEQVQGFLTAYPQVMFRMLKAQARRLRETNQWSS
ncbi:MAG: cyclic nucleotide-binding domain-containing protein [Candidatus Dormibacteraeota bacterium]|nr:cyclic nucleotide-binding domain-containing protein [Candidatus Dormibacteraeota bacterium]